MVAFYCITFVFGPSIIMKSLNEINLLIIFLIDINLQTNCQNLEASLSLIFFLLPLKLFAHLSDTSHKILLQKLLSITPELTEKACKN